MNEELKNYYFTFGFGQEHAGCFVKISAKSYLDAREEMVRRYGIKWSFQYTEDEWIDEDGTTQEDKYCLIEIK